MEMYMGRRRASGFEVLVARFCGGFTDLGDFISFRGAVVEEL